MADGGHLGSQRQYSSSERDSTVIEIEKAAFKKGYRVNGHGQVYNIRTGKIRKLQECPTRNGQYLGFSLRVGGLIKTCKVHRLVGYEKFGLRIYNKGLVIRHKNCKWNDNRPENILIGTQSENLLDWRARREAKELDDRFSERIAECS